MPGESEKLEFNVLGPLRVFRGEREIEITAPMQRRLLLRLLLDANTALSLDRLQETLWPGTEDDKAKALRFHVSKLRDLIDPDRSDLIATVGDGYEIRIDPDQVDAHRFVSAVDRAHSLVHDDPTTTLSLLDEALGSWRGTPYPEAESVDFTPEVTRLKETRLRAIENRLEAMLELGRHEEAVEELGVLVTQHPLREKLRGQQMLALYRSGRAAEALRAYEKAKQTLGEELGIEPSPALAELEEKILFGEAELLRAPVAQPTVSMVPAPTNKLIGRGRELSDIEELIGESRLVTLIGIGGVGKTRLAQEFARDAQHGHEAVWWVELAGAQTADEVVDEVMESIGATPRTGESNVDAVVSYLERRRALVVLDNCEHLADPVARLVSTILEMAPAVTFLITSRIPLRLTGESLYRVPRLETRSTGDDAESGISPAARFLAELAATRGQRIDPGDLGTIASIATRLEGVPLALELAVARLAVLTPTELDRRLEESLAVLGSTGLDQPEHRQTMSSTIDWSVELLSESAASLFARLGVFKGGATIEAIESVCGNGDPISGTTIATIEELVSASLIEKHTADGHTRFTMLDAVADVARTRMAQSPVATRAHQEHASYYADFSERSAEELIGIDQSFHFARFDVEEENLRAGLAWARDHDPNAAVRLVVGLGEYLFRRGRYGEAQRILQDVIDLPDVDETPALAAVIGTLAELDVLVGDTSSARKLVDRQLSVADSSSAFTALVRARLTESSILWSEGQTRRSVEVLAAALDDLGPRSDPLAVYVLRQLGRRYLQVGRRDQVPRMISHLRWWSDAGHPLAIGAVAELEGGLALYVPDYEEAERRLGSAADSLRAIDARIELAEVLNQASNVALARLDQDMSTHLAFEALDLARESLAKGVEAQALSMIGWALLRSGRPDVARRNLATAIELALTAPAALELFWAVSFMAAYQSVVGAPDRAVLLYSAAEQLQTRGESAFAVPPNLFEYRRNDIRRLEAELGEDEFEQMRAWGRVVEVEELLELVSA